MFVNSFIVFFYFFQSIVLSRSLSVVSTLSPPKNLIITLKGVTFPQPIAFDWLDWVLYTRYD